MSRSSPPAPFQYANFGYIIVGAMIEKTAGVPGRS